MEHHKGIQRTSPGRPILIYLVSVGIYWTVASVLSAPFKCTRDVCFNYYIDGECWLGGCRR